MIDRRTFLKLSAGALVLTAAGALTGCGGMNDRPKVTIDGVVFMCEAPVITGGSGYAVRYCPLFAIQNDTGERVYRRAGNIGAERYYWHLYGYGK